MVVMGKEVVPQKWCEYIELKMPVSCILIKQAESLPLFLLLLGKDNRFDLSSCIVVIHLHLVILEMMEMILPAVRIIQSLEYTH